MVKKPVKSRFLAFRKRLVQFLNNEGKGINIRKYNYTTGDTTWRSVSGSGSSISIEELNQKAIYNNFDIRIVNSNSIARLSDSNIVLSDIPGNSYKNDGTGVAPIYRNGLTEQNGEQYYYVDGVKQKGDGGWLYLNAGQLRTNSTVLYADGTYNWAIAKGRRVISKGHVYYFSEDGAMARGKVEINGDYYLFDTSGKLLKILPDGTEWYDAVVDQLELKESPSESAHTITVSYNRPRVKVPLPKRIETVNGEKWIETYYYSYNLNSPTGWRRLKDLVEYRENVTEGSGKSDYDITYNLNEDEALFVAVVAAESIGEGQLAWQVVSNVIMNRVGQREWSKLTTPTEVMKQKYQFSCLNDGGSPQYLKAVNYLKNRVDDGNTYEQIISVVMPIYHREVSDITGGAQLYYSPKSMVPPGSAPSWASVYKQITVPGIKSDDFMLYTGEKIQ